MPIEVQRGLDQNGAEASFSPSDAPTLERHDGDLHFASVFIQDLNRIVVVEETWGQGKTEAHDLARGHVRLGLEADLDCGRSLLSEEERSAAEEKRSALQRS